MRELTFFTSNATKLAHARYIAEGYSLRIKGFRQRTYHANYDEPRLSSRAPLLDASYRSALRQCAKAGIAIDSHPFILEDTSVTIHALSADGREVPGLDVKFWMQEQSFDALDSSLKARGNNRTVTVRSDVLLHVPKNFKGLWGIHEDYIIFVGEQLGHVVEQESQFEPNLVYPWLDNQSFNKWFKPQGMRGPFGALAISEANDVDFRRKSFEQLFKFLLDRKYLLVERRQLELELDRKPNLALSGFTCAGKTTASQHLARKFGYLHIEASDFMYLNYYYRHDYKGALSIGDFAEQALSQKPEIAAEKVAEYIANNLASPFVLSGFRAPEEIEFLRHALAMHGKSFEVIFVDSDEQTRFRRLKTRMRPGDDISMPQFLGRDDQQRRMGLERLSGYPSVKRIENSGTVTEYLRSIEAAVGQAHEDEITVHAVIAQLGTVREVKLEDAILIALLGAWKEDETRPFFSTTQIAQMINDTFKNTSPKHKDNVSRYFNQDYYAYYEITDSGFSHRRRYRLSNTGYGMAIRALRMISKAIVTRPFPL
jgi:dephospho-CoA kinase/inosine/xanthosine triphosphate pyrophosphatase family protein